MQTEPNRTYNSNSNYSRGNKAQTESNKTYNNNSNNNGSARVQGEGDGEAVCEICNNFLNLKLRNGSKYTPYGDHAPHSPVHQHTTNPTNTINTTITTNTANTKNKPTMYIDTTPTALTTDTDLDTDYTIPEPLDRCAICGLSSTEAEKLQMYTGEALGEMFSCDGNCGHQFHVRCVGK